MSEVTISVKEVSFLKKELQRKAQLINPLSESIPFNSNPKSYAPLKKIINKELKSNHPRIKIITTTFLRDFFYNHSNSKAIRTTSIDKFYYFLFDMPRSHYIGELAEVFNPVTFYCYSISKLSQDIKMLIGQKVGGAIESRLLDLKEMVEIEEQYVRPNTGVVYYVDEDFILRQKGFDILLDLFSKKYLSTVLDYNVQFFIDPKLLDNDPENDSPTSIRTAEGRNIIKVKMLLKIERIADFKKNIESVLLRNKADDVILQQQNIKILDSILKALLVFNSATNRQELMSVTKFLPSFLNIENDKREFESKVDVELRPLTNIYDRTEDDTDLNQAQFNFFCVIGYKGYLREKEKTEMIRYFFLFQETLKNHRITRIFSVRSIKTENGLWRSNLTIEENKLLFQYILINLLGGVETILIMYEQSGIKKDTSILWNQDYVLQIRESIESEKSTQKSPLQSLFNSYQRSKDYIFNQDTPPTLFFGYPEEDEDNNNSMILVRKEGYIEKFYKDFCNRIRLEDEPTNSTEFINMSKDTKKPVEKKIELLRSKLSLEKLEESTFKTLLNEVSIFYPEPWN